MGGWVCEAVTCGCLSFGEVGVEAAGVAGGWLVGPVGLVTCGCLSSGEVGVEAAGAAGGWLVGPEGLAVTCSCLASVEVVVEAAGGHSPEMASAGMAVQ